MCWQFFKCPHLSHSQNYDAAVACGLGPAPPVSVRHCAKLITACGTNCDARYPIIVS